MNIRRLTLAIWIGLAVFFGLSRSSLAAGRQFLHGHVPSTVSHLQPLGRFPGTNHINLAIGLPLRNKEALANLLQQIYDPASPNFRQFLTPDQFTERFGPTEQDYQAVIDFTKANGLAVTARHGNRVLLDVNGSAKEIEKAFHVTLRSYQHPRENRKFFAPDAEPSVDLQVSLADVSGLSDYSLPHPKCIQVESSATNQGLTSKSGSGSGGTYVGADFRNAYVPGTSLDGTGQMVGLVEFDGYYSNDIVAYENLLSGSPRVPLQTVLLDSFSGTPTASGNIEVSLDIEMAIAMAPGLSKIVVFEGNPATGFFIPNDVLNSMAASNTIKNLSCSWGWNGGPSTTTENIFLQMAAQGQSFFNASGDSDAFTAGQVDSTSFPGSPSSSPNITQVGGTTLTMSGLGAAYTSETVWNRGYVAKDLRYEGSSGGISSHYSIPAWQQGISMTANLGSTTQRNIPDVAMTAENVYVKYNNGGSMTVGGTSCAAPLWAGFVALVNQQATAAGRACVGFVNPSIYELAKAAAYTNCFHDITTGNNFWSSSLTNYPATTGYDLCTGWGTPNGINLINALATPDVLVILPGSGFFASGQCGGPFNVTTQSFSLTNAGADALSWSLVSTSSWLSASPTSGTLTPGGPAATVTMNLNSAASNLFVGSYVAEALFTNLNSHITQSRSFSLVVQPSVQNGGFETGDYSNWYINGILNGTGGNSNFIVNSSVTINSGYPGYTAIPGTQFIHSGLYGTWLGQSLSIGYLSQMVPTVPGQPYLLSFWFENSNVGQGSGTSPNVFLALWNTNTVFGATNLGIFTWTNMQCIVTATGTNAVVKFGFRNDPGVFSLDDVSVTAVPVPAFQTVTITNNAINFTWNTLSGLVYQLQYRTNLLQTNWLNLGPVITATDVITTATNIIGPDPRRFYRLQLLY